MKKSFMTRMLAVSLSAAMTFSLSSASSLTATEAAAKKLPANNKAVSISLKVGNSKVLKLKNYKAWNIKKGATNKKAVAAVANKGTAAKRTIKVTAKKKGTAKVTLTLGKRKTADSKTTKYSKTIKKVVTVKVKAADTTTPADTTDTTPTDTTTPTTPSTTTGSATNVTPGALYISEAKVTKADVISVSFSSIVASTSAVKVTVTRENGTEPIKGNFNFAAGGQGGEFVTVGKLSKGTYVVSATDGKDTTTAKVEVEKDQEVATIEFVGDTALTGRGNTTEEDVAGRYAYVYYQLKDQYGTVVNDTFSAQWTASADIKSVDRASGRITLQKTKNAKEDGKVEVFNFSEKIYVTGVYTKTGVTNSATFSVGTEQSVDKIEFVGFVKKNGQNIEKELPKDFKANQYQLLYKAKDQNGNEMEPADYLYDDEDDNNRSTRSLTFVSDNVLVIKEILNNNNRTVTVAGEEYCAANVVPGINVNKGGMVNLSAIATKTGTKNDISVLVGQYRILHKFSLMPPAGYVVDGEAVEIPFEAEDENGNKMTLFKELATQTNFSRLTFNESVGTLRLEEMDNGEARLVWYDTDGDGKWNRNSTDGIDRPVSLTAIVVGGETSNEMIQVSDHARPEGIAKVDMDDAYVDDSHIDIQYDNFEFVDQYGRNMKETYDEAKKNHLLVSDVIDNDAYDYKLYSYYFGQDDVYDGGFFEYVSEKNDDGVSVNSLTGTDFKDYTFGINVEFSGLISGELRNNYPLLKVETDAEKENPKYITGSSFNVTSESEAVISDKNGTKLVSFVNKDNNDNYDPHTFIFGDTLDYYVHEVSDTVPEVAVKSVIRKVKLGGDDAAKQEVQDVGKKASNSFKVVPLDKLSNYKIDDGDMEKFHIETELSNYENGQKLADVSKDNTLDIRVTSPQDAISALNSKNYEKKDDGTKSDNQIALEETQSTFWVENAQNVKVLGYYSGTEIEIPYTHVAVYDEGAKLIAGSFDTKVGETVINQVVAGGTDGLRYSDLYDITKAHFDSKDANETLEAYVYPATKARGSVIENGNTADRVTSVRYTASISDTNSMLTTFVGADTYTMRPDFTKIDLSDLITEDNSYSYWKWKDIEIEIKDQYGNNYFKASDGLVDDDGKHITNSYNLDYEFTVLNPIENKETGYVDGNFKVVNNASSMASIEGAEMGDTFTVEIKAEAPDGKSYEGAVYKTVQITVGADQGCHIVKTDNWYSDSLLERDKNGNETHHGSVRDYLQEQLNELLGTEGTTDNK